MFACTAPVRWRLLPVRPLPDSVAVISTGALDVKQSVRACAITLAALCLAAYGNASATDIGTPPSANRGNAEARFEQGLKLAAANKIDAAIKVFLELTQDYPLLPQPHIQLAALYVQRGETPKAVGELRAAIEYHLDDRRLEEQLGDLYLKLAIQSYNSALDTATPNPALYDKYSALKKLSSGADRQR